MVHDAVKTCVEEHDIERLKYIFVDCLDVDPTFEKYKGDYEYCMNASGLGLFEEHVELTPMRKEKDSWDISYWNSIKMDLIENFSTKRFQHMREVAKVVHAEKIERLLREREQKLTEEKRQQESQKLRAEDRENRKREDLAESVEKKKKPSEIQKERLEEERKRLELENKKTEEERIRKQQNQQAQSRVNLQTNQEAERGKKEVGIVVVVLIVAIMLIVLLIIRY